MTFLDLVFLAGSEFKPCAIYNEALDCISVVTIDCSVVERWITDRFTLLEKQYPDQDGPIHAGFSVEGARFFCKENNLPYHGKVRTSEIIRKMSEMDRATMPAILDIALPMLIDFDIDEVEFPTA